MYELLTVHVLILTALGVHASTVLLRFSASEDMLMAQLCNIHFLMVPRPLPVIHSTAVILAPSRPTMPAFY